MLKVTVSIVFLLSAVCAKNDNNKKQIFFPMSGTQLETSLKAKIINSFNYQRSNVEPTAGDMRYIVSGNLYLSTIK